MSSNSNNQQQQPYPFDKQLWLGTPDETVPDGQTAASVVDSLYNCRIGGQPVLMYSSASTEDATSTGIPTNHNPSSSSNIKCPSCKSSSDLTLLSQIFAPLFDQDRILYVFVCRKCAKNPNNKNHPEKAILAVRCQNFTQAAVDKFDALFEKQQQDEDKKSEESTRREKQVATATFAAEDDWGSDDDTEQDGRSGSKSAATNAKKQTEALVNVAAQKQQEEIDRKLADEERQKLLKNRPSKKPAVLPVQPTLGLGKEGSKSKPFAEYSLDIYDYDESDDNETDDDDDDSDDGDDAASGSNLSAADVKKQLEDIKKRFPNAEIDLDSNPVVAVGDNDAAKTKKANLVPTTSNDDDGCDEQGDGDDDKARGNSNSKGSKKEQDAQRQAELHLEQFGRFVKRITRQDPSQVIRWQPSGSPLLAAPLAGSPLPPSSASSKKQQQQQQQQHIVSIPKCERCGSDRMFEYQLVSPLIYFLTSNNTNSSNNTQNNNNNNKTTAGGKRKSGSGGGAAKTGASAVPNDDEDVLNFATVLVFTCSNPYCDIGTQYVRDHIIVQQEPVLEQSQIQQQQAALTQQQHPISSKKK